MCNKCITIYFKLFFEHTFALSNMIESFKYTENPEAETPRMFIDKEIGGTDSDGLPNISGNDFLKELLYLSDTLKKKEIEVWINSPGGIVTEGQSIYTAILESKANVNTYCYGIAASIAGVIFQAGKKRIMADYAKLMYHPAYSEDGKMDKGLEALNHSICVMIAKRTGKTEDECWEIMNKGRKDDKGTWIDADTAKENGFCDEVTKSDAKNKNAIVAEETTAIYHKANLILNRVNVNNNQIINKKNKMKTVLNKLGLVEDANETSAIAAIDAINKSMDDMKKEYDKKKAECEDLKSEMDKMKKEAKDKEETEAKAKKDMEEEADKAKKAKEVKDKEEEEAKNKKDAEECVKNAVAVGKIKNDATLIASYTKMYVASPTETKNLIETLPATRTAPIFNKADGADLADSPAQAAARAAGIKPGSASWYTAIKNYNLQVANAK